MPFARNAVSVNNAAYDAAHTYETGFIFKRVNLTVKDAEIYYQLKIPVQPHMKPNAYQWSDDIRMVRAQRSLDRVCSGIRLKMATATTATVDVELLQDYEIT
jgi:hypothetical protein